MKKVMVLCLVMLQCGLYGMKTHTLNDSDYSFFKRAQNMVNHLLYAENLMDVHNDDYLAQGVFKEFSKGLLGVLNDVGDRVEKKSRAVCDYVKKFARTNQNVSPALRKVLLAFAGCDTESDSTHEEYVEEYVCTRCGFICYCELGI